MVIQRHLGDPCLGNHPVDSDSANTLCVKQLFSRFQNSFAGT